MFENMDYIYMVYKCGSFTQAAKELYISQPALSIAIKKVEKSFGQPLFQRNTSPITLTDAGREYIRNIETIRHMEASFSAYCDDLNGLKSGTVHIGASSFVMGHIIPPILSSFSAQYPGICVKVYERNLSLLPDMLHTEKVDIIVDSATHATQSFESVLLFKETPLLGVPRQWLMGTELEAFAYSTAEIKAWKHLEPGSPRADLSSLASRCFILPPSDQDSGLHNLRICSHFGLQPKSVIQLDQSITSFHFVRAQIGVAFLSDVLINSMPDQDDILYLYPDCPDIARPIYVLRKKNRYYAKATQRFVEAMQENLKEILAHYA